MGLTLVAVALLVPTSAQAACSAPAPAPALRGGAVVVVCPSIPAEQVFVVPSGVTSLRVVAVGARGGSGGSGVFGTPGAGGAGALVSADLRVTPGLRLFVLVGGAGADRPAGPRGATAASTTPGPEVRCPAPPRRSAPAPAAAAVVRPTCGPAARATGPASRGIRE